ncbi:MAG TPA: hypothetical protein VII47_08250 [Actinomycetota bacterium]|jgi:hypothetical protein
MDLATMADKYLWDEGGVGLSDLGPAAAAVHEAIGNPPYTMPFLATLFWRLYLDARETFHVMLHMLKASRAAMREREAYIVRHGKGGSRYDLVILDPDFPHDEPVARQVKPLRVDIRDAGRKLTRAGSIQWQMPWGPLDLSWGPDAVDELVRVQEVGVVICPKPQILSTGCPAPAWTITTDEDRTGTAGAIVTDGEGRIGVTAALHTVSRASEIRVDGRQGTVVTKDEVTDSAFVHVPRLAPPSGRAGLNGPLTRLAPAEGEEVRFDGAASGAKRPTLVGWQPTILTPEASLSNNRCITTPDTEAGDSGAALVDSRDHILGFATHRSVPGAVAEFSGWVWAHHVFRNHGLTLVSRR